MRSIFYAMVGVGCLSLGLAVGEARGGPAEDAVRSALDAQSRWLGSGQAADGWHKHLQTAQLEEQLARGQAADPVAVDAVIAGYNASTPGLDRPQFTATRRALEDWRRSLPPIAPEQLPEAVRAAKQSYVAPSPERAATSKARLQNALARLNSFLARGGAERRDAWRAYLRSEQLEAELAKESPDVRALQAIQANYFQNEVGLDLPQFMEARAALRDYTGAVLSVSDKDPQAAYEARLDELAKALEAYAAAPKDNDAVVIGEALDYLATTRQGRPLLDAIRGRYSYPNLYVVASERLASSGVNRPVNDVSPVREVILGTDIHGTAHTVGQVSLRMVPHPNNALLELVMTGTSRSNNVGYNGPVTICSQGYTRLSASKRIIFNSDGLVSYPAVAVAQTNTTITGIDAKNFLIRRIATKRVAKSKGEAQAIASQRAERRVEKRVESESAVQLADAAAQYQDKFRRPLVRKDAFPQVHFSTTADEVRIVANHAARSRIGAPGAPPKLGARYDLSVRVHESLVGNASETGVGGKTLTDERLAELVEEATGEVPEELQITEDKDPWSITFSTVRPFSVVFEDQTATIAIHGERFTRGDREIKKDMIISAKYKLEQTALGAKLTRQGEVVADYAGNPGSISVSEVAFKSLMRKKFSALFKPEFESEGLKLPGRWADAGKLTLRRLDSDNGWLTLGWEQGAPRGDLQAEAAPSIGETIVASILTRSVSEGSSLAP